MAKVALQVRMTDIEYEAVKEAALSARLSLSEFVRRQLFERLTIGVVDEQERAASDRHEIEPEPRAPQEPSILASEPQAPLVGRRVLKNFVLCPRCQRIGRPSCPECLASKAPRRAQEASGDEQATETSATDAGSTGSEFKTSAAAPANDPFEAPEASLSPPLGASDQELTVAQPGKETAAADASAVRGCGGGDRQGLLSKPTVNAALGNKPGAFRESPKCQNSRCARLKMPLCEPCRVLNKGT